MWISVPPALMNNSILMYSSFDKGRGFSKGFGSKALSLKFLSFSFTHCLFHRPIFPASLLVKPHYCWDFIWLIDYLLFEVIALARFQQKVSPGFIFYSLIKDFVPFLNTPTAYIGYWTNKLQIYKVKKKLFPILVVIITSHQ